MNDLVLIGCECYAWPMPLGAPNSGRCGFCGTSPVMFIASWDSDEIRARPLSAKEKARYADEHGDLG